jgi:homoserine dehydrogenase
MRTIRVAVAGLGVVGRETVRLLRENKERFGRKLGASVELSAVCDRAVKKEAKALGLGASVKLYTDPGQLAARRDFDIVVELMGGLEAPRKLVLEALKSGRHVVTANKRLIATEWDRLRAASSRGGRLAFEGSVGGGIPVLQALESSLSANTIESVYGVLNGTTNYILSAMERGAGAADALAEAQRLGFAEKDPSMDLSGRDTAQKVSVLAALLTGAALPPDRIAREGIERVEAEDVSFALGTLRRVPRLIGALRLDWRARAGGAAAGVKAEASVFPTLVPLDHPLAAVRGEYNAILIKASAAKDLMLYGKGAGGGPTASAVVGDVYMLSRELLCATPPGRAEALAVTAAPVEESVSGFYLRLAAQDRPGVLAGVARSLARGGISIATIHQSATRGPSGASVILTTHPARHGAFTSALSRILSESGVGKKPVVMRMLP